MGNVSLVRWSVSLLALVVLLFGALPGLPGGEASGRPAAAAQAAPANAGSRSEPPPGPAAIAAAAAMTTTWQIEPADAFQPAGYGTSLALDAAGRPHISYMNYYPNPAALKYAYYDGQAWITETVASAIWDRSAVTSLALDAAGQPHVVYPGDIGLRYAYYDGSGWVTETLGGVAQSSPSLVLDAAGRPHISYIRFTQQEDHLEYAYRDGSGWITQTVGGGAIGLPGARTSLALDAAGLPHISYSGHCGKLYCLKYAYYDGAQWHVEAVDTVETMYASLALDAAGRPHVAYCLGDYTEGYCFGLRYAHYDGSAWQVTAVHSGEFVGSETSLALDAEGYPHISYHTGYPDYKLWYAQYDGTAWVTETVADGGYSTSLALDAAGRPHISYRDGPFDPEHLMYAYVCTPLAGVDIAGPAGVPVGETALYTATAIPPTATYPLATWSNGAVGISAAYSWTAPGSYTLTVTATNACSQATAARRVTVCWPVQEVAVAGPAALTVGQAGLYSATYAPLTATLPVTLTWDNGTTGPAAIYSWTVPGSYTVTVTAANVCCQAGAALAVTVRPDVYRFYLPLVVRRGLDGR